MVLEITSPLQDLKQLSREDLHRVADEARQVPLEKASQHGGYNEPNFDMVEMTVAMHYIFNSPIDKFIFDVSYQLYVHKMLTGRAQTFLDPTHYDDVSGYTNPEESEHDLFTVGHTSTSLSLASGVARARDLKDEAYNVVAVVGDGSFSDGMAYEGLNQIATKGTNTIVVINGNDQLIAVNPTGGICTALRDLREGNGQADNNLPKALGFGYHYPDAGSNLDQLTALFEEVKDTSYPVLLHIHAQKGYGMPFMEGNRGTFHAGGPYNPGTGEYLGGTGAAETYSSITTDFVLDKIKNDSTVVVVNVRIPMFMLSRDQRKQVGKQFVDVGIVEEGAATMSAGLAKNGAKLVWYVASTSMQCAYDQQSYDIVPNNLPVTALVYMASVSSLNGESHLSFFDIPFLAHIPNVVYLAPTSKEEHPAMLDWVIEQKEHPVAICIPVGPLRETGIADATDYSTLNKNQVIQKGSQVALFGLGNFYGLTEEAAKKLADRHGTTTTIVNPKFIAGLDEELLDSLEAEHQVVVTLEDGILEGGHGQMITSYLGDMELKVQNYGVKKTFHDRCNAQELLAENGITIENIANNVLKDLAE